jgi:peptide/nickel transport system substrate-binding protein
LSAAASYAVQVVDGNIFEALYARDNETVELVPELATGSKVSDDHLTYTFYLREDAFFSDGVPLTAKDVKFTFDAILDPKNDTPDMRSFLTDIESVEAIDDYTVQIKVSKPYFLNLTILSGIFVLPEHVYGKGDFNTIAANRNPVGSGPYVFESWETGGQLMLAKSDTYWGEEKRHVEKLVYRVITDDNAAFQALKSGEIDVSRISPEQYELDTSKPSFQKNFYVEKTFSPVDGYFGGLTYMGWNTRRPKFSDKRVRRALTMLVDRDTLLEKVWRGLGRVATGYHSRDAKESNPDIVKIPFDPDGAAKLLEEAGWVDTNNDGVRDKDGIEFKYEFIYSSGINEYEILATTYKENLTKAGIEVTLRPLEFATLIESVQERTFDSFVAGWSLTYESDPYQLWHTSQSEQGSNYTGFGNAETDKLIEDARLEFDRDKRVTLYRRLHQILHDEQPYTFLFNRQRVVAASKRFQNVTMYKQGFDILEWWVPVELQKYH